MKKEEIRKKVLNKRKETKNKEELSTIIVNKIINLDVYKKASVIALYKSLVNEVNTDYLINETLLDKKVLLPKIVDDKMVFIEINKNSLYIKSKIGVMEPKGKVYKRKIDVIIVPGVAFDNNLNRLGFGKGYYDKYLKDKDIYKIGLCFESQLMRKLPINELDIPMDLVITEKRVLKKT